MAPTSNRTLSHCALGFSFLGSIVLGMGWLHVRSQRSMMTEQNLALATANAEWSESLAARQKQADDDRAAVENRISRLENEGHIPAALDDQKRALDSEILDLRKAIVTMQQQAEASRASLLKRINEAERKNVALFEAVNQITVRMGEPNENDPEDAIRPALAKSLTITIVSDGKGQVASTTVGLAKLFNGPLDARRLQQLDRRLKDVFAIEGAFDQVLLRVGKNLDFGELRKIIEVCTRQKKADGKRIDKISFVEIGEPQ
jgi:hypothetical protein